MLRKTVIIFVAVLMLMLLCSCQSWRKNYEAFLDDLVGKVDVSQDAGKEDTETMLREKLEEYAEGNTVWFQYGDFDADGVGEAFAFVGKVTADYNEGIIWYVNENYAAELCENGKWKSPEIITADNTNFLFAENYEDGLTYVYGIENSKVYETAVSGMFSGLRHTGGVDFTAEFTSYDYYDDKTKAEAEEPTTKLYWFYLENGEFHEYGGDDTRKRADLRKYDAGSKVMDEIYKNGLTAELLAKYYPNANEKTLEDIADDAGYFDSIMFRENGIINLNFYGAYDDCFYITFKITGEGTAEVIDQGRGFYLKAAVESIATYPENE